MAFCVGIYFIMTKHFESLWEDAEILSAQIEKSEIPERAKFIINEINALVDVSRSDKEAIFGKILFHLCGISQKFNVNTYASLMRELQNRKVDSMDDEE